MPTLDHRSFLVAGSLAYVSFCVNPLIYASRYEVFRRFLKNLANKGAASGAVASQHAVGTVATTVFPANTQH